MRAGLIYGGHGPGVRSTGPDPADWVDGPEYPESVTVKCPACQSTHTVALDKNGKGFEMCKCEPDGYDFDVLVNDNGEVIVS